MCSKGEDYDVTEIYEKNKAWFKITEIDITIKEKNVVPVIIFHDYKFWISINICWLL